MTEPNAGLAAGLICGPYRDRANGALDSLLRQTAIDSMEIFVVDCAAEDTEPIVGVEHPRVRLLRRPGARNLGRARVEILNASSAELVWFLEEHSIAFPRCAEALMRALAEGWAAVAPEVRRFPAETFKSRILNCRFSTWIGPTRKGQVEFLMGHNVAYRRDVLEQYADHLEERLNCEYLFHLELTADGHRLTMEPDAAIYHALESRVLDIARGVMNYERMHVAQRRSRTSFSNSRLAVATIVGPLVKPIQAAVTTVRDEPSEWAPALTGLPYLALIDAGSSLGRVRAWINGEKTAAEGLGRIELDRPRMWWREEPRSGS